MNLLGYRAFSTELLKIATEVRDPDIRAMIAEVHGKEYLNGGALRCNSEAETNFKPKLAEIKVAVSFPWVKGHIGRGVPGASTERLGRFAGKMKHLGRAQHGDVGAQADLAHRYAKTNLTNRHLSSHFDKTAAPGFMAFTPVGTYNVRGKKPTAQGSGYETASNFAGTALRGGMTGAGAATLGHTLQHGHDAAKLAPRHLGMAVAGGAGLALADRAIRRHSMKKQLQKLAMFSPARQLHATQSRGDFENKVHNTPLKSTVPAIGRDFRLPPQGA